MSGAHKLQKLHQYQSDRTRVIHLVRALDAAGWPTDVIMRMTGLNRRRVTRIIARVHWYWVRDDDEFYERIAADLPWLRPWQRALLSGRPLNDTPQTGQYDDVDRSFVDKPAPQRCEVGG